MFSKIIPAPKPVPVHAATGGVIIAVLNGGVVTESQTHISGSSNPLAHRLIALILVLRPPFSQQEKPGGFSLYLYEKQNL